MANENLEWKEILELVKALESLELEEFRLEQPGLLLSVSRNARIEAVNEQAPRNHEPERKVLAASNDQVVENTRPQLANENPSPGAVTIDAPVVGVFYAAPSPGESPFVAIGDAISEESTVGIIEVMKLMNPVSAGKTGKIVRVLVQDGEQVQYGQPLFEVEV